MTISLTGEVADYVETELSSGDYASANEVVRNALLLMRHEREVEGEKLQLLKEAVLEGVEAAERGDFSEKSIDEILKDVLAGRRD